MANKVTSPIEENPEEQIQNYFDQVIQCVENRRKELLTKYRKIYLETNSNGSIKENSVTHKNDSTFEINQNLSGNNIQDSRRIMESVITNNLVKTPGRKSRILFHGNTDSMEILISGLGEVSEEELPACPLYDDIETVIAVRKPGKESFSPNGVTVNKETKEILVAQADGQNIACISIFTENGKFLESFENKNMIYPYGLCTFKNNLYVTDFTEHIVLHFRYNEERKYIYVNKSDRNISRNIQFKYPGQFDISSQEELYIPDMGNKRIQVLDRSLQYQYEITHTSLVDPQDVKLTQDEVYVLHEKSPHIQVFSYSGQMIRTLLTETEESNISLGQFFCLDAEQNIIISDREANKIKIFTNHGEARSLQESSDEQSKLVQPMGVVLTKDAKIVIASHNMNSGLHILFKPV